MIISLIRHRAVGLGMLFSLLFLWLPHGNLLVAQPASVKIRDIAAIEGVRSNQLVGFGLVTGLQGEGDSSRSRLNKKLLSNLLASFDVKIAAEDIDSKNSAAVVVTAEVPPFIRVGQTVD